MNTPPRPDRAEDDHETVPLPSRGLSRRGLVTGVAVAAGMAMIAGSSPAAAAGNAATGSVAEAPKLPRGFADTFTDRFVQANGIRQHVVIGGNGPPLLLVHGLADDNVVAAHTLQLSSALLAHGRPHQVLPLTGVTHMASQEDVAENLLLLQLDFLRTALGLE